MNKTDNHSNMSEEKCCPYCGHEDIEYLGIFAVSVNPDSDLAKTHGCHYCKRLFYEEAE